MNSVIALLTTFTGRISRRQWWIGFVITLLGSVAGTLLFNPEMLTSDEVVPPRWPDTIWQLACLSRHGNNRETLQRSQLAMVARICVRSFRRVDVRGAACRHGDRP